MDNFPRFIIETSVLGDFFFLAFLHLFEQTCIEWNNHYEFFTSHSVASLLESVF
jgi:hypothetical protein